MRTLAITSSSLDLMMAHARRAYPEECCGALFGATISGGNEVQGILEIDNEADGDHRTYFSISPGDYLRAEREAERLGLLLLGFYHSHPDHPARPSDTDRAYAQPGFSYPILAVTAAGVEALTSWYLPDGAEWYEKEMVVPSQSPVQTIS